MQNGSLNESIDDFHNEKLERQQRIPIADIINTKKPFISTTLSPNQRQLYQRLNEQGIMEPIICSCKFKIGYVSADKNFFHPNADIVAHYSIPKENLHPAILNIKELNGSTGVGIVANSADCSTQLYLPQMITDGDKQYIKSGEASGVHLRYKCRQRKPWYVTPCVAVPDVILSVFGETPKMVANKGDFAVSNSLLCGYLGGVSPEQLLCRWYNSLTLLSLELNVHSLGGGSFVIIPGEADRISIIGNLPQAKVADIFFQLDEAVKKSGLESAYALGDRLVLQDIFDLSEKDIGEIRDSIDMLRNWRNPVRRRTQVVIMPVPFAAIS